MGLQPRSDLKQVVIDFDGPEYTATTVWHVGAWNDAANTWMGMPHVLEDVMPSVDAAAMKKFNDAVGTALAEVMRQNVSLRQQRDAAKVETDLNVSVQRDQQSRIAALLKRQKELEGNLLSSQQDVDRLRYAWGVAAGALAKTRSWKYRLTLGFFGS